MVVVGVGYSRNTISVQRAGLQADKDGQAGKEGGKEGGGEGREGGREGGHVPSQGDCEGSTARGG